MWFEEFVVENNTTAYKEGTYVKYVKLVAVKASGRSFTHSSKIKVHCMLSNVITISYEKQKSKFFC